MRRMPVGSVAWLVVLGTMLAGALPAQDGAEFAVATIKPSDPSRPDKMFGFRGQDVIAANYTLKDLVKTAYTLHEKQVTGGPSWMDSDKYDIMARPSIPGQPSMAQLEIMIQKLVADRFQLKFHREKKQLAVYAITVAKGGDKLTKSQDDPNGLPAFSAGGGDKGGLKFDVRNATLAEFMNILQGGIVLDKPVVDQTLLSGKFDILLKFTPDPGQKTGPGSRRPESAAENPDAPPDLFTAFQQQLGLKLASTKAMVDVLVIDHVEKPSAN